ncbi:DUF4349 domain-containing protein [Streptomonospora nanhaiensis]|uniref:DUF4349 domain-containing protein n=3 Tax=Streptomonospora nanhaiensis TaxID=1323731 RepID=A0A853BEM0_9ACTN|nr:DUF4349 domain-containing protein [Streptomonospora nanhaiensis]MBV2366145.1 DUF4349 domain-containing protein [Streptomonospora nanhaiensis]NYI93878.1 hypothetical protein [Streptomonospora nanhaiensis]
MSATPPRDEARRRPLARGAAAAPLLLLLALAAGCSATSSSGGADASREAPAEPGIAQEAPPEAEPPGGGAADGSDGLAGDLPLADRDLVYTADLRVEVEDVDAAAERAGEWVADAGGYIAAESVQSGEGDAPYASLTLQVPRDRYEAALDELAALGSQSSLDRRVQDVTEEVADVDSRVESAEASLDRLRDLLDEAGTVQEVLAVEAEISTRQQELESLQARQEALSQQVSYSTVNLELMPPETYVADPGDDSIGFLGGLQRGWRALVGLGEVLAVAAGWLLPFAVPLAVAGTPAWLLWRRRRARRRGRPAAPGGAAAGGAARPEGAGGSAAEDGADGTGEAGGRERAAGTGGTGTAKGTSGGTPGGTA